MEADDLEKVVHATAEETRKTIMLQLEATIKRLIAEAIDQHLEDYMHSETPLTVAERDEETAQKETP